MAIIQVLLGILSVIALSESAYNGELNVPGTPVPRPAHFRRDFNGLCGKEPLRCADECQSPTIQMCNEEGQEPTFEADCPEENNVCAMYQGNPKCVKPTDSLCEDFSCPGANRAYPDLSNCNRYYFCNKDRIANLMACPPDFVFDPLRSNCGPQANSFMLRCRPKPITTLPPFTHPSTFPTTVPSSQPTTTAEPSTQPPALPGLKCLTVTCKPDILEVVPYAGDRSLYAVCMFGNAKLQECPDPQVYSPAAKKCELACSSAGKFPFRNNCRGFYHCQGPNAKGVPDECAEGTVFNSTKGSCDPGTCKDE